VVCVVERFARLAQEPYRAFGGYGTVLSHECLEVEAIEQLHDVVEDAV
jgi:hypothetical protein